MNFVRGKNIVFLKDDEGKTLAYVTFPLNSEGNCVIDHTVVDESLRGQGIAGKLMLEAYDVIKSQGLKAVPVCSYAVAWFDKNEDKKDILA